MGGSWKLCDRGGGGGGQLGGYLMEGGEGGGAVGGYVTGPAILHHPQLPGPSITCVSISF